MPLTNAQKQQRARAKRNAKMERLETALRCIVEEAERENGSWVHLKRAIAVAAREALNG